MIRKIREKIPENPTFAQDFRISQFINRNRRKRPKVDASIFDSALNQTRCSDASEKREENIVSTFGRFRLLTSFESSPVSVYLYFSSGSDSGDSEGDDADGLKALLGLGSTLNNQTYL